MLQFDQVLKKALASNPDLNQERLKEAFIYTKKMHEGRYRLSGDPSISHYVAVMDNLIPLRPDDDTLIAGLLHGVKEMPGYDENELRAKFGENVNYLVNALASIKHIKARNFKAEAESMRRMFVAMAKDLRVILIKLADRLHNMETIGFYPVAKQKQIARETMDLYVPISARLGIYTVKGRLEDSCFKHLLPRQYAELKQDLDDYLAQRETNIDEIKKEVRAFLKNNNIEADVEGRIKNLYSIYRKLKLKAESTLRDLYDVFALRIILPDRFNQSGDEVTDHLYAVLGLIHSKWKPVSKRFKDYVAFPKPNGYASLHTAVLGLSSKDSQVTEIQIRSKRMHELAEYGVASHWIYDAHKKKMSSSRQVDAVEPVKKYIDWVDALAHLQNELKNGKDSLEALKIDVFSDRIFVMTPDGGVKDLPKGSTPIDLAYSLDSDLGNKCVSAKINGNVVPLDYQLKNGEVVDVITNPNAEPKAIWLSFVKTSQAKKFIKAFFKSADGEKMVSEGRIMVNKFLQKAGKKPLDEDLSILRKYKGIRLSLRKRKDILENIGNGTESPSQVLNNVYGDDLEAKSQQPVKNFDGNIIPEKADKRGITMDEIFIAGEQGMPYKLASCCKPKSGMPILGYINRNHVVTIHQQKCRVLREIVEERILEASWGCDLNKTKYPVKLFLWCKNRIGLIRDIADVIAGMNIDILYFADADRQGDMVKRELVLQITDNKQLTDVVNRLQKVRSVQDVSRAT